MNNTLKLGIIGFISGIILMIILKMVMLITGNPAYILLFNFDYIPVIQDFRPTWLFGYLFHFVTCIVSVIALYYILKIWHLEKRIIYYILVYSIGGGGLFFLTSLSPQLPESDDWIAWIYWTLAHAIFGISVGGLIKKWI